MHKWNQTIEKEEKDGMSWKTNQMMDRIVIQIKFSLITTKLEKDINKFGKVSVESSPLQEVLLLSVSRSMDEIKLTNIGSFQTPGGTSRNILITGIEIFDDGTIVSTDHHIFNSRLLLMNLEDNCLNNKEIEGSCYDVAVIEKDTIAATQIEEKDIIIIYINSSTVQMTLLNKRQCRKRNYSEP